MKFHWMKIISLAAIAMVRGQNNEISFFDERERERGGGRRDCPTFVENICNTVYSVYMRGADDWHRFIIHIYKITNS